MVKTNLTLPDFHNNTVSGIQLRGEGLHLHFQVFILKDRDANFLYFSLCQQISRVEPNQHWTDPT